MRTRGESADAGERGQRLEPGADGRLRALLPAAAAPAFYAASAARGRPPSPGPAPIGAARPPPAPRGPACPRPLAPPPCGADQGPASPCVRGRPGVTNPLPRPPTRAAGTPGRAAGLDAPRSRVSRQAPCTGAAGFFRPRTPLSRGLTAPRAAGFGERERLRAALTTLRAGHAPRPERHLPGGSCSGQGCPGAPTGIRAPPGNVETSPWRGLGEPRGHCILPRPQV